MNPRNRSFVLLASLALSTIAPYAHADTPPAVEGDAQSTTKFAADIEQLLKEMSSDDWKQRQQAADAIGDLDPSMLPRLRKALDSTTDVDLHSALLTAVKRVEDKALIMPSLITLHLKDATATDALNQIAAQVPYDLVSDATDFLNDAKLTVDADHLPFWAVMKLLSPQWPVRVVSTAADPGRISLVGSGNNYLNVHSAVAGPFVICPLSLNTNANLDLLPDVPQLKVRSMQMQVAVLAEPKLRATRFSIVVKEAVDENGKSVTAADANPGMNGMAFNGMMAQPSLTIRINPPADVGKKIARMTGVIRCRVPTRSQHVEVAGIADGKEHTVDLGGRQVKVIVTPNEKQFDVKILLPVGNMNPQDEQSMAMVRDMNLLDNDGNPLYRRFSSPPQVVNGRSWQYNVTFGKEGNAFGNQAKPRGDAVKVVWELAVESKDMESPFELINIPLQ